MWIVIDGGNIFEGTMEQFVDCFGGPATKERVIYFATNEIKTKNFTIYQDGEWIPGKPQFDGTLFCCFKNPYSNEPPVIQGECAVYSNGEVLFLSELVTDVYGWLPISICPFAPKD